MLNMVLENSEHEKTKRDIEVDQLAQHFMSNSFDSDEEYVQVQCMYKIYLKSKRLDMQNYSQMI